MNRKEFLKLLAAATAGTPFLLNGLSARVMNQFLDLPVTICEGVEDRVLVIVRLTGGNDGLNTVIPVSQYDTYRNLRPKIGIKNLQGDGLDSGLKEQERFWLNPVMKGFKRLYDNNKIALINGVGYPIPNYSHFQSEHLMFSGKDGSFSGLSKSGMLGRYLTSLFPEIEGCPVTEDPLAVVLGSPNSILFYEHDCQGVEYNTSGIERLLFDKFKLNTSVLKSNTYSSQALCSLSEEYKELLQYIEGVEGLMSKYHNRVQQVFNNGSNYNGAGYENTSLAKQLRVVARMIRGGSKTKIFQVNLRGFDTHVGQNNDHDKLLKEVSSAIEAFQKDIEDTHTGSIADKVMMVTFSEFGRTIKENGNEGTDHGNLSPFFVIGKGVQAGVYGENPELRNANVYDPEGIKYDYRQLFASLVQDWLGAEDSIIDKMELSSFKGEKKIPFIHKNYNAAYNKCFVPQENFPKDTYKTTEIALFPNPVTELFSVRVNSGYIEKLEIYDVAGALITVENPKQQISEYIYPMAHYNKGMYFVKVYWNGGKQKTFKIIKE